MDPGPASCPCGSACCRGRGPVPVLSAPLPRTAQGLEHGEQWPPGPITVGVGAGRPVPHSTRTRTWAPPAPWGGRQPPLGRDAGPWPGSLHRALQAGAAWGLELEVDVPRDPGRLSGPQCPRASVGSWSPRKRDQAAEDSASTKQAGRAGGDRWADVPEAWGPPHPDGRAEMAAFLSQSRASRVTGDTRAVGGTPSGGSCGFSSGRPCWRLVASVLLRNVHFPRIRLFRAVLAFEG